jgi:integrase
MTRTKKPRPGSVRKITRRTIRGLKPPSSWGTTKYYLMERGPQSLRGFGLCVYETTASYVVRVHGRSQTIGPVEVIPLKRAREDARQVLERLFGERAASRNGEPVVRRRLQVKTVQQLSEKYMADYARPHKAKISANEDQRMWNSYILPFETTIDPADERSSSTTLGAMTAALVTRDHVEALHLSMRETPVAADRVLALISTAFNQAALFQPPWFRGTNPTRGITRFGGKTSERRYSRDEYARIGAALRAVESDSGFPLASVLAVRAIARSGARPSEIASALVSEVDVERGVIRRAQNKANRPGKKPKVRIVHVPREILERALELPRPKQCPYLFPGNTVEQPIDAKFKRLVLHLKEAAKIPDFTLKALRHSYRSEAPETQIEGVGAIPPEYAARVLGHTTTEIGDVYMHSTVSLEAKAAAALSERIGGMLDAEPAKVVSFPSGTKVSGA